MIDNIWLNGIFYNGINGGSSPEIISLIKAKYVYGVNFVQKLFLNLRLYY